MLLSLKIVEVVELTRTRIVEIEVDEWLGDKGDVFDYDKNEDVETLQTITRAVKEQHSKEGDMTELVMMAKIL